MSNANDSKSHQLAYQSKLRDCPICSPLTTIQIMTMSAETAESLIAKHYESMSAYQIDCAEQSLI